MVEQTVSLEIFFQLFALGAFMVFLAFAAATFVLMVHLTGMPERRRAPRQPEAATSFAD